MTLSNNIRDLRFKDGEMTQKDLAGLVGVSRQAICSIENNRQVPSLDIALRIANVFGIGVEDVFEHRMHTVCDADRNVDDPDTVEVIISWDDD